MSLLRSTVAPPTRRTLLVVAAIGLLVGFVVGAHGPWASTHVRTYEGVGMRANDENDLGFFDADDSRTQNVMYLDSIRWEAGGRGGEGSPPCLGEPLQEVRVEVGIMTVPGPGGGSQEQVAWVHCP